MSWQDLIGTTSYALLAASYLVTNIYWLRLLAIVALTIEAVYFYLVGDRDLWVGILWAGVFNVINIVQLIILARARMKVRMSVEESALHASAFGKLEKVDFNRLLAAGAFRDISSGTQLTRQDQPVENIHLLVRGKARVIVGDRLVASLEPGAFIGEMAFLGDGSASATVVAGDSCRSFVIAVNALRALTAKYERINATVTEQFAIDLARKLRSNDQAA